MNRVQAECAWLVADFEKAEGIISKAISSEKVYDTFAFRAHPDDLEAFKALCLKRGVSPSALLRQLMLAMVEAHEHP